jgi:hypothetical protein
MTHTGGCLCGAVRYAVDGPLRDVLVCHCVECRRWAGGAWPATAARRQDLRLVAAECLRWERTPASESGASHGWCERCGSSVFWDAPGRATVSIGAGTLDHAPTLRVAAHIWVSQAPSWEAPPGTAAAFARGFPADAPQPAWR